MPLYDLHIISKTPLPDSTHLFTTLIKKACMIVNTNAGVVRHMRNHGDKLLPYPMTGPGGKAKNATTWMMQFYASPECLYKLTFHLRRDPMVVRHNVVKLGNSLRQKTPGGIYLDKV